MRGDVTTGHSAASVLRVPWGRQIRAQNGRVLLPKTFRETRGHNQSCLAAGKSKSRDSSRRPVFTEGTLGKRRLAATPWWCCGLCRRVRLGRERKSVWGTRTSGRARTGKGPVCDAVMRGFLLGTCGESCGRRGRVRMWVRYLEPESSVLEAGKIQGTQGPESYRGRAQLLWGCGGETCRERLLMSLWGVWPQEGVGGRHLLNHLSEASHGWPESGSHFLANSDSFLILKWMREANFPLHPCSHCSPPWAHWGWIIAPDFETSLVKPTQPPAPCLIRAWVRVGKGEGGQPRAEGTAEEGVFL